ncbi:MAG: ribonuclease HI family protein [Deltaproteobacteria bacterium]|nr:ribonuclease HI family protein [Deltaproteobacteria bacterium]
MLKTLIPAKPAGQTPLFKETSAQKKPDGQRRAHAPGHTINVDGASRGNPGLAGAGAVIRDRDGTVVKKLKKFLGSVTNNVAEYQALIMALEAATHLGLTDVRIYADSELMVKQINGVYKVKSVDLKPLYDKAMLLIKRLPSVKLSHIMREENSLADAMANEAIDTRETRHNN